MPGENDHNDPEIQKNGIRALADEWEFPDVVVEEFLQTRFDPTATAEENLAAFPEWLTEQADRCPTCDSLIEDVDSASDDGVDELILRPCGHSVEPAEIELEE